MQARLKTDVPLDNNNRPAMDVPLGRPAGLDVSRRIPPYPQVQGFPGVKK